MGREPGLRISKSCFTWKSFPNSGRGKALVVITHDEDFLHVADRVVRIDGGRLSDGDRHLLQRPSEPVEARS